MKTLNIMRVGLIICGHMFNSYLHKFRVKRKMSVEEYLKKYLPRKVPETCRKLSGEGQMTRCILSREFQVEACR